MIPIVCGKPRGGKSYYACVQICEELLRSNRYVVTNLPLDLGELAEFCEREVDGPFNVGERVRLLTEEETHKFWLYDPEGEIVKTRSIGMPAGKDQVLASGGDCVKPREVLVPDFARRQAVDYPGVLYVIDEAHVFFPARNWAGQADVLTYFLSQHGHMRSDVMFVTQHPAKLTKHIRLDAQEYTVCSNLGYEKGFMGVSLPGVFRRSTYLDLPGGTEKPVETGTFRLNVAKYGKLYSTSAGVGLSGRVDTQEQRRGKHWSRWAFAGVGFGLAALVVPFLVLFGVGKGVHAGLSSYMGAATGFTGGVVTNAPASLSQTNSNPRTVPTKVFSQPYGVGPSPLDRERNAYGTRLEASGVYLVGISPVGVALDDGRVLHKTEFPFMRCSGGVIVQGMGFVPWLPPKRRVAVEPGVSPAGGVRRFSSRSQPGGAVGSFSGPSGNGPSAF